LAERNIAIDFVKGFLVIAMTLGHTVMYFVDGRPLIRSYTFCARPGFVFFAGIICGVIYLGKFQKDKKYVLLKLLTRSLKIITLFFGLNILIHLVLKQNYTGQNLNLNLIIDNLGPILLTGDGRLMAFEILIPISYVLLLSVPILQLARLQYFLYALIVFIMFVLSLTGLKIPSNLYYSLFGAAGVCSGLMCTGLKSKLHNKLIGLVVMMILLLYFFVLIPGKVNVIENPIITFIYVSVVIAAFYLTGSFLEPYRFWLQVIIKFGQYSLYLYLTQILFLQVLYRLGMSKEKAITTRTFIIFAAVSCSMVVLCYLTDYIRNRFPIADKIYRFVLA
jgi:hypothetical protein